MSVVAPSLLLRLYGTLVPPRVRAAIRGRLSPRARALMARRLTRTGRWSWLRSPAHKLRYRAWTAAGYPVVTIGSRRVHAMELPGPTPLDARRATASAAMAALNSAGVPYFCVRGRDDLVTTLGVPESARAAAETALWTIFQHQPGYLTGLLDNQPGRLRRADRRASWQAVRGANTVRVIQFITDPSRAVSLGPESGCDLEFWAAEGDLVRAPRPNRVSDVLPADGTLVPAPEPLFSRTVTVREAEAARQYPTRTEFLGTLLDDITFPVDVVYTWVDGADPHWRDRRVRATLGMSIDGLNAQAANESRYTSRDELRYSLRSLHQYAPWVNHIWLVTDQQVPAWLRTDHPRITVVDHREIFADPAALPTFNSHAIESQLHRIDGLTEHFLYFNDDVLLGRPVLPHLFFHPSGLTKFFPSTATIDPTPPSAADAPVTAAGKNNRRLLEERYGRRVTQKMKHCPHALRRSILAEITEAYPEELAETARHRFRDPRDVSLTSALFQNYTLLTARATTAPISYMYSDLSAPQTPYRLRMALARRNYDVMCLNDTDSRPEQAARQHRMLAEFLAAYYPVAAPWELSAAPRVPAQRRPAETPAGVLR